MEIELDKISAIMVSVMAVVGVIGGLLVNTTFTIVTGPILGVVAGFILSYFVQTRTQRRAWKRDYVIKSIDSIYGPLHDESIKIEETYNNTQRLGIYFPFIYNTWSTLKNNYKYHLIDDKNFRKEINEFYDLVEECNTLVSYAKDKVLEIIRNKGSKFYDLAVDNIYYFFRLPTGMRDFPDTVGCLINGIHPRDAFKKSSEAWEISVIFNSNGSNTSKNLNSEKDFREFDELWKIMLKDVSEDQNIPKMKLLYNKVQSENLKLRAKLVERIQLQWKV